MPKHKSEDYKISAVQYYIENGTSFAETCRIFKCSERSLKRWIERYNTEESIKRHNRISVSYKITDEQIAYNSIHNIERPSYLCRTTSGVLHDIPKPKFTRSETGKPC